MKRLVPLYADMPDGELEKVAAESGPWTEEARQALRKEITIRKLTIEGIDSQPQASTQPELQRWIMIRRFRDLPEAILAKGSLDSAGIECTLTDDNMFVSTGSFPICWET